MLRKGRVNLRKVELITPSPSLYLDLIKRSPGHHHLNLKCRPCPAKGKAGDSRCKVVSGKIATQKPSTSSSTSESCPPCGCQKCPDNKMYANSVTNYCKATESETCSNKPKVHCLVVCESVSRCETLDFDRSQVSCGCACQKCPDENYYQATGNYTSSQPLNSEQQGKCPSVLHPLQQSQNLCS